LFSKIRVFRPFKIIGEVDCIKIKTVKPLWRFTTEFVVTVRVSKPNTRFRRALPFDILVGFLAFAR
jgi:hypothetical protein